MIKHIAFSFVIASALMHVFCCGIPLLLSISSLATLLGVTSVDMFHMEWFENFKPQLIIISGAILALTAGAQWISARINCREDGACSHEPCDSKKTLSQRIFYVAVVLYAINLVIFLMTGTHTHTH